MRWADARNTQTMGMALGKGRRYTAALGNPWDYYLLAFFVI
jgi:hypothetical protein